MWKSLILLFFVISLIEAAPAGAAEPVIRLHYLGHSSFIIRFDNGVSILTDYGFSRSFGLPSPIYDLGDFQPTIVMYSHSDQDHDRMEVFDTPHELRGQSLSFQGIEIKPIPVSEGYKNSNFSYLIAYKGFTILHMGDAQGDIVNIGDEAERKLLKIIFPDRVDLLLMPIGWTKDILKEAETALAFLKPKRAIPMHYWHKETKTQFLNDLSAMDPSNGTHFELTADDGPEYAIESPDPAPGDAIRVISLEPKPYHPE